MTDREKDSEELGNASDQAETTESAQDEGPAAEATEPSDEPGAEAAAAEEAQGDEGSETEEAEPVAAARSGKSSGLGGAGLAAAAVALLIGGAGGWFGHQMQTQKAMKAADAAVEGQGDAARGPCKDWETKICEDLGDNAYSCQRAKASSDLLPGSACKLALEAVPATLTKIHAARTSCDAMSTKLCAELGADSPGCKMVESQTPSFPPDKCDEIAKNYDQVLAQLKQMGARGPGGPPGMGGPHGPGGPRGPGGPGRGPGPAPGAMPPGHP